LSDRDGKETGRITLVRARATSSDPAGDAITSDRHIGPLEILELQPEGRRPMSLDAFRNGHRFEAGMRIESIA
jgi:hypothetical protein